MMGRSFLPTWFAIAAILTIQMVSVAMLPETPRTRGMAWSADANLAVFVVVVTVAAVWAFPRIRPMSWLIGAMCIALIALVHSMVPFHGPIPPPAELLVFYTVAAVLLAIGAWQGARAIPD